MLPQGFHQKLGSILRKEREAASLTQPQIGAKLTPPVSYQQVGLYESGAHKINVGKLVEWCAACNASPMRVLADALSQTPEKGDRP